jgi:2-iminobutanoate/2-iminopropanoate deaminase
MPKERVLSPNVAETGTHWSMALRAGNLLFISGQTSRQPDGSIGAPGDVAGQSRMALTKIQHLCEAAGATMEDIVKLTLLLRDIDDQDALYSVYPEFFSGRDFPTDTLIGNVHLARPEFLVEIEAIVALA